MATCARCNDTGEEVLHGEFVKRGGEVGTEWRGPCPDCQPQKH